MRTLEFVLLVEKWLVRLTVQQVSYADCVAVMPQDCCVNSINSYGMKKEGR